MKTSTILFYIFVFVTVLATTDAGAISRGNRRRRREREARELVIRKGVTKRIAGEARIETSCIQDNYSLEQCVFVPCYYSPWHEELFTTIHAKILICRQGPTTIAPPPPLLEVITVIMCTATVLAFFTMVACVLIHGMFQ